MICLIDGLRGVYAPRVFAERYGHLLATDTREALLEGPDGEWYYSYGYAFPKAPTRVGAEGKTLLAVGLDVVRFDFRAAGLHDVFRLSD